MIVEPIYHSLRKSGIYAIKKEDAIVYVGSSVNMWRRLNEHLSRLRRINPNKQHFNPHLQNSWDKYGEDVFEFVVLEECEVDQLLIREQHYLDTLPDLYNICQVAGSRLGHTPGPETRAKIGAAQKGRKHTKEHNEKIRASMIGNTYSLGHVHTDEHRAKNSAARMGNQNAAGSIRSEEHKAAISAATTGIKRSEEAIANMVAAQQARRERERLEKNASNT